MIDKRETAAWRDQQADAMGSVNDTIQCGDAQCETSERWADIKDSDEWQVSNDPEMPLLCPECAARTSDPASTPTQARKQNNRSIKEYDDD